MSIIISDTNMDLSKLQVGKTYRIEFEHQGVMFSVYKALIKRVDIDKNEFEYEPLVERSAPPENHFIDISNLLSIEMKDSNRNVVLKCL